MSEISPVRLGIFPCGSLGGGQNANGPIIWLDLPRLWSLPSWAGISLGRNRKRLPLPRRPPFYRELTKRRAQKAFLKSGRGFGRSWIQDRMSDGRTSRSCRHIVTCCATQQIYLSCQTPEQTTWKGSDICTICVFGRLRFLSLRFEFSGGSEVMRVCGRWTSLQQLQRSALRVRRCQAKSASIAYSYVSVTPVQSSGGCLKWTELSCWSLCERQREKNKERKRKMQRRNDVQWMNSHITFHNILFFPLIACWTGEKRTNVQSWVHQKDWIMDG